MKPVRERAVEQHLVKEIKRLGGKCIKLSAMYENAIPDRLVLYNGKAIFVETKREGKKPSKAQALYHKELEKIGFAVEVLDSREAVNDFIYKIEIL